MPDAGVCLSWNRRKCSRQLFDWKPFSWTFFCNLALPECTGLTCWGKGDLNSHQLVLKLLFFVHKIMKSTGKVDAVFLRHEHNWKVYASPILEVQISERRRGSLRDKLYPRLLIQRGQNGGCWKILSKWHQRDYESGNYRREIYRGILNWRRWGVLRQVKQDCSLVIT